MSDTPKPATRKWLWPLLIGSLALNLFILGAFAGRHILGGHGGRWHHDRGGMRHVLRHMPDEQRDKVRKLVCQRSEEDRAQHDKRHEHRRELRKLLDQETVDFAAVTQQLETMVDTGAKARKEALPGIIEALKIVEPDKRRKLLHALLREGGRKGWRKGWRGMCH